MEERQSRSASDRVLVLKCFNVVEKNKRKEEVTVIHWVAINCKVFFCETIFCPSIRNREKRVFLNNNKNVFFFEWFAVHCKKQMFRKLKQMSSWKRIGFCKEKWIIVNILFKQVEENFVKLDTGSSFQLAYPDWLHEDNRYILVIVISSKVSCSMFKVFRSFIKSYSSCVQKTFR